MMFNDGETMVFVDLRFWHCSRLMGVCRYIVIHTHIYIYLCIHVLYVNNYTEIVTNSSWYSNTCGCNQESLDCALSEIDVWGIHHTQVIERIVCATSYSGYNLQPRDIFFSPTKRACGALENVEFLCLFSCAKCPAMSSLLATNSIAGDQFQSEDFYVPWPYPNLWTQPGCEFVVDDKVDRNVQ